MLVVTFEGFGFENIAFFYVCAEYEFTQPIGCELSLHDTLISSF